MGVCVSVDFVKCGCVYVLVLLCVGVLVICVLVFTVFSIVSFMYIIYFVCTSVRTTATERKLNCSSSSSNNNSDYNNVSLGSTWKAGAQTQKVE